MDLFLSVGETRTPGLRITNALRSYTASVCLHPLTLMGKLKLLYIRQNAMMFTGLATHWLYFCSRVVPARLAKMWNTALHVGAG